MGCDINNPLPPPIDVTSSLRTSSLEVKKLSIIPPLSPINWDTIANVIIFPSTGRSFPSRRFDWSSFSKIVNEINQTGSLSDWSHATIPGITYSYNFISKFTKNLLLSQSRFFFNTIILRHIFSSGRNQRLNSTSPPALSSTARGVAALRQLCAFPVTSGRMGRTSQIPFCQRQIQQIRECLFINDSNILGLDCFTTKRYIYMHAHTHDAPKKTKGKENTLNTYSFFSFLFF